MSRRDTMPARQRGLVLVSSLLLLLVLTLLALAMFRSMGLAEKISGNVREKTRALHAAVVAEQYAEWWLSNPTNSSQASVLCNATANANLGPTQVLICSNALVSATSFPWTATQTNAAVGISYYPNSTTSPATSMIFTADASGSLSNTYSAPPAFYISYCCQANDGGGSVYRIDAMGYGGNSLSVAVVESMYEIGSGVTPRGGL
ncbi:MAG TPA: PilX N-terminal domain-containing pilus assembly protein [Steroidobacteraceae bacterium]|nr:PilX N-terminal domain-containing pilus assembly protein [Steroidobacteraceae bacterium]